MRFPLTGLIRLASLAGLGLSCVAVGIGRMNPTAGDAKAVAPIAHAGFSSRILGFPERGSNLLNLETGQMERLDLPEGELFDQVSSSPWRDRLGQSQLVGRWVRLGAGFIPQEFGLARFSFPGGVELGRLATDILPSSPPCWYPGMPTRVLFSALDGALYRWDFDNGEGRGADLFPQPLTWRSLPEGIAALRTHDPTWPADPALGGRILLDVNVRPSGSHDRFEGAKLWWLRLDPAGAEVLAAGRLTRPEGSASGDRDDEERFSVLGRPDPNGPPMIAYLARSPGETY